MGVDVEVLSPGDGNYTFDFLLLTCLSLILLNCKNSIGIIPFQYTSMRNARRHVQYDDRPSAYFPIKIIFPIFFFFFSLSLRSMITPVNVDIGILLCESCSWINNTHRLYILSIYKIYLYLQVKLIPKQGKLQSFTTQVL